MFLKGQGVWVHTCSYLEITPDSHAPDWTTVVTMYSHMQDSFFTLVLFLWTQDIFQYFLKKY